ncbi:MAG: hypothetical protein NT120_02435 [Candidatus Aenigmarchaeota archaeon]|nr:hypothetical protein [Candidatus Aenigmarchaeota archaeon]
MISDRDIEVLTNYSSSEGLLSKRSRSYGPNEDYTNTVAGITYLQKLGEVLPIIAEQLRKRKAEFDDKTPFDAVGLYQIRNRSMHLMLPMEFNPKFTYERLLGVLYDHCITILPPDKIKKKDIGGKLNIFVNDMEPEALEALKVRLEKTPKELVEQRITFSLVEYDFAGGRKPKEIARDKKPKENKEGKGLAESKGRKRGERTQPEIIKEYITAHGGITVKTAAQILNTTENSAYQSLHLLRKKDELEKDGKEYKFSKKPDQKAAPVDVAADEVYRSVETVTVDEKIMEYVRTCGRIYKKKAAKFIGCNEAVAENRLEKLAKEGNLFQDDGAFLYTNEEVESSVLKEAGMVDRISIEKGMKVTGLSQPVTVAILDVLVRKEKMIKDGGTYRLKI